MRLVKSAGFTRRPLAKLKDLNSRTSAVFGFCSSLRSQSRLMSGCKTTSQLIRLRELVIFYCKRRKETAKLAPHIIEALGD